MSSVTETSTSTLGKQGETLFDLWSGIKKFVRKKTAIWRSAAQSVGRTHGGIECVQEPRAQGVVPFSRPFPYTHQHVERRRNSGTETG
jgi:hypothetical protein